MTRSLFISAVVLFLACTIEGGTGETKTFRLLSHGAYGAAASGDVEGSRRAPFVVVATDAKSYEALWREHVGDGEPSKIDFSRETAVFLIIPPRPTGGYSVEVRDVTLDGKKATVNADLLEPKGGDMVTQAFTAPYAVIALAEPRVTEVDWVDAGRLLARKTVSKE